MSEQARCPDCGCDELSSGPVHGCPNGDCYCWAFWGTPDEFAALYPPWTAADSPEYDSWWAVAAAPYPEAPTEEKPA